MKRLSSVFFLIIALQISGVAAQTGSARGDVSLRNSFGKGGTGQNFKKREFVNQTPVRLTEHEAEDRYPSFSPDGRKILFESNRNGNWDIFVMNADGSDVRQITPEKSDERFPVWNKTGTRILFTSDRSGDTEIYSMRPDGRGVERLTTRPGAELFPVWSPEGEYISFTADLDLFLLDTSNSAIKRIASSEKRDVWLRFSPDGKKAAFFSRRDTEEADDEIYIMDFPEGRPERITNRSGHDFCPVWSPDGKQLAVAAVDENEGRSINIIDLTGKVISRKGAGFERVTEPNWSPDGKGIVYTGRDAGNYDIYFEKL